METSIDLRKIKVIGLLFAASILLIVGVGKVKDFVESKPKKQVDVHEDNMQVLFRGVPHDHFFYDLAEIGIAEAFDPIEGHNNPVEHRDGNTNSVYTSWTTDINVAINFATTDTYGEPCCGIILAKKMDLASKNITDVRNLLGGDLHDESEFLVEKIVEGCVIYPVCDGVDFDVAKRKILEIVK